MRKLSSTSSADSINNIEWTKIISLFLLIFIALCFLPAFDYHRFLLPPPDDVAMLCRLQNITRDETLGELPDGHIITMKENQVRIFLYATNIRKDVECRSLKSGANKTFTYHNVYLNLLHTDIDGEVERMRERYSFPRKKWFYDREEYDHLLGKENGLDRHGLREEPIDIYKKSHYWPSLIVVKIGALLLALLLTVILYKVFISWRRRYPNCPTTYHLPDCC